MCTLLNSQSHSLDYRLGSGDTLTWFFHWRKMDFASLPNKMEIVKMASTNEMFACHRACCCLLSTYPPVNPILWNSLVDWHKSTMCTQFRRTAVPYSVLIPRKINFSSMTIYLVIWLNVEKNPSLSYYITQLQINIIKSHMLHFRLCVCVCVIRKISSTWLKLVKRTFSFIHSFPLNAYYIMLWLLSSAAGTCENVQCLNNLHCAFHFIDLYKGIFIKNFILFR